MANPSGKYILLLLILAFAFAYRLLLMHQTTFPPGADIGLHNSVMHSITRSGNTDFFYNFYHMGGGLSLTFPGYHIFVAFVVSLTKLPDYLAHSLTVSIFSTITVACAFLITRKVWGVAAGLIVAFLVAVSRFDLEMLMWGGYPNVITLMLMGLTFYLFLQTERFGRFPFLFSTTLFSASIYITHSLSTAIFVLITVAMALAALLLSNRLPARKRLFAAWLMPLGLGALIVSPFLIDAISAYASDSQGAFTGGALDIQEAILSTKILPLQIVIPLFLCVIFFFLFSRKYLGKYLTIPALLFTVWVLVPMFLTQGYLIDFYTDYNRFLYFVLLPVIMLIGLGLNHIAGFFARIADLYHSSRKISAGKQNITSATLVRVQRGLTGRNTYAAFTFSFLLISFLFIPIFMNPAQGVAVQSFYQVMTDSGYEAIQWAKENTDANAVFVADALYGWWFSGFALRPTLSAVPPQYITLSRELDPAGNASYLLDTDYVMDNGLIQVREDGGYIGRHNPLFLGKLNWTYFPYPFFNFDNDDTIICLDDGTDWKSFTLGELDVIGMKSEKNINQTTVTVVKGNNLVNFTQTLTVYENRQFANMSISIESAVDGVTLRSLDSILHIRGEPIIKADTVGLFEEGSKVLGQLIYVENYPEMVILVTEQNPSGLEFRYNLHGASSSRIQFFASAFSVSDSEELYENTTPSENPHLNYWLDYYVKNYLKPEDNLPAGLPISLFEYKKALADWGISYLVCRDPSVLKKFNSDPAFGTVFINDEVALFKVKSVLD